MLGGSSSVMAGASYTLTLSPSYSGNLTGWEVKLGATTRPSSGSIDSGTTFPHLALPPPIRPGNTYPVFRLFREQRGKRQFPRASGLTVNNPSPPHGVR